MDGASERQIAAILLIAGAGLFVVGGALFTGRTMWKWSIGETYTYLVWERGFVMLALLVNVLGIVLLKGLLHEAGAPILARLALIIYLIGAIVALVAETSYLHNREWAYPQIVLFVVLAFLGQAAFGVALTQTDLVGGWVGWATVIWNLAWLVILPLAAPKDIYFPVLHHVAPLLIGIALLG